MARPYSNDLRGRVAGLLDRGYSCREVAELCEVSVATVVRYGQRQRQTGSADAKPMGGARHDALGEHRAWLHQRRCEAPDLTLRALQTELADRGLKVSIWTIWSCLRNEGLTYKKKSAAERAGPSDCRQVTSMVAENHGIPAVIQTRFCR